MRQFENTIKREEEDIDTDEDTTEKRVKRHKKNKKKDKNKKDKKKKKKDKKRCMYSGDGGPPIGCNTTTLAGVPITTKTIEQSTPWTTTATDPSSKAKMSLYITGGAVVGLLMLMVITIVVCRRCLKTKSSGSEVTSEETAYSTLNVIEMQEEGNVYMEIGSPVIAATIETSLGMDTNVNPYFVLEKTSIKRNSSLESQNTNPYFELEKVSEERNVSQMDRGNDPYFVLEKTSIKRNSSLESQNTNPYFVLEKVSEERNVSQMDRGNEITGSASQDVGDRNSSPYFELEKTSVSEQGSMSHDSCKYFELENVDLSSRTNDSVSSTGRDQSNVQPSNGRSLVIIEGEKGNKYDEIVFLDAAAENKN